MDGALNMLALSRWALVGATNNPERAAYDILHLLHSRGYRVFPVTPRLREIEGFPTWPDVASLPEVPDVINLVVNPAAGIEALKQAHVAGVRHVWVQPGAESEEIRSYCREHHLHLVEGCVLVVLRSRPELVAPAQ
jgi:predicted CoA-binding protein